MAMLGIFGSQFIFIVEGGYRAVIFDKFKGLRPKVYGEGMHFKIPFLHIPTNFEVRSRYRVITSVTGTRDL